MRLTGAVIVKDEEESIGRSIKSLSFCDEVLVIDDNSTDKTVEVAKKLGAVTYKRSLRGDFAAQRNYALGKAKNDWVIFIDADEVVSDTLKNEILAIDLQSTNNDGFYIKRRDVFIGKKLRYGESGNIRLLRFGKKKSGKWSRKVHEHWDIEGNTAVLKGEIIHFAHKSLREFIVHISEYSKIHAKENTNEEKVSNMFKVIFYPIGKFINNYFYKLAILDGMRGFVLSIFMSFHSFISWSSLCLSKRHKN